MNKHPQHSLHFFFLYLNVGRGSECTAAAGVAESLSEDDRKQVSLSPQKMANKLVRLHCFFTLLSALMVHLVLYYTRKVKLFLNYGNLVWHFNSY